MTSTALPTIDRQFVTSVMKVLCKKPKRGRPPSAETMRIKPTLTDLYKAHYEHHMVTHPNYQNMSTVLDYLTDRYHHDVREHHQAALRGVRQALRQRVW